jgi:hypothetical protein
MKIQPDHLAALKALIAPIDTAERRAQYIEQRLSDKRYRWDLTYAAGHASSPQSATRFICDTLYSYLNDTHIDTALKSIVSPLAR